MGLWGVQVIVQKSKGNISVVKLVDEHFFSEEQDS